MFERGGGGGGSGGIAFIVVPSQLIPDTLWVYVGLGNTSNFMGDSYVAVSPMLPGGNDPSVLLCFAAPMGFPPSESHMPCMEVGK